MNDKGFLRGFENPDDINKYWHQVTEKELEEQIEQVRADLEDSKKTKKSTKTYKKDPQGLLLEETKMTKGDVKIYERRLEKDLQELSKELKNLRDLVDNYQRCLERFKRNKKILREIQQDWEEYNSSLFTDYCRLQAGILGGREEWEGERLEEKRREARQEIIKREEIEKRIRDLLSK